MREYYRIPAEDFATHSQVDFRFVGSYEQLLQAIARELVDLIKRNSSDGKLTKVILPVGPLDYSVFARLCNRERVSCESLVVFAMDDFCNGESVVSTDHPMSFRAYFQRSLLDRLDSDLAMPAEHLILPEPGNLEILPELIEQFGGIDVTYGGFGINGHFAFNTPPNGQVSVEAFRQTSARVVELREGDIVQTAMGGTGGNLEIIPAKACTLGMRELLSAEMIHLTFMRSWHAGVLRRALFGRVSAAFPGSLVQLHPNVRATITHEAAALPRINLLQGAGSEGQPEKD